MTKHNKITDSLAKKMEMENAKKKKHIYIYI